MSSKNYYFHDGDSGNLAYGEIINSSSTFVYNQSQYQNVQYDIKLYYGIKQTRKFIRLCGNGYNFIELNRTYLELQPNVCGNTYPDIDLAFSIVQRNYQYGYGLDMIPGANLE